MEQKLIGGLEEIAGRSGNERDPLPVITVKIMDEPNEVATNTIYVTLFDGKTQCKAIFLLAEPLPLAKNTFINLTKYSFSKNKSILIINEASLVTRGPALPIVPSEPKRKEVGPPPVTRDKVSVPIRVLNSFLFAGWQITARIFSKSELKHFTNFRGEDDEFFTIDIVDREGDEIRASVSGKEMCGRLYETLKIGGVYTITNGAIRPVNRDFTPLPHNFEISLGTNSEIVGVEDDGSIPRVSYHFVKISAIAACENGAIIDVIGVVSKVDEPQTIVSKKSGKSLIRRTVTLFDSSMFSIELTLWNTLAEKENPEVCLSPGVIIAAKWCRVSSFNSKSLSATFSTWIDVAPEVPETASLQKWLRTQRKSVSSLSLCPLSIPFTSSGGSSGGSGGEMYTIKQAHTVYKGKMEAGMPDLEEMNSFYVCGAVSYIRHDSRISYSACPVPKCSAKVSIDDSGRFYCQKCNKHYDSCEERYILLLRVSDFTDSLTVTAFNSAGEVIMGISAGRLNTVRRECNSCDGGDDDKFEKFFKNAIYKWYTFRIKPKLEFYHEEQRIRYTIVSVKPLNFAEDNKRLLKIIRSFL